MTDPRFVHGVASGDPEPDGVVLWTRVSHGSRNPAHGAARAQDPVSVRWWVAAAPDPDHGDVVAQGEAEADAGRDFTVKVDVRGLEPATTYHYGFEAGGVASPVGRTRTAPTGANGRVRLGVVSCACWPHGFFNAYAHLAERDVDLVLHVGDYIYENVGAWEEIGRVHEPPRRVRTLADYRARHAQYRTDPDLQRLHQRHPVVAVWDDHDIAGNAWREGAVDHDPAEDGDWEPRRAAAVQAYLEWLPVRSPDEAHPERIYRSFRLGDLAQLTVMDTRLIGRDRPVHAGERTAATVEDQHRSMLGPEQREWLRDELRSSTSRWQLLASQVMMAPLHALELPRGLRWLVPGLVAGGVGVNAGQWDGYPDERAALFAFLRDEGLTNIVVLSGDLHSSWAGELTLDPEGAEPPVGVEFLTPSVTSRSFAEEVAPRLPGARAALRRLVASQNPHFRYFDLEAHGYVVVDVTPERVRAEIWHVDTVAQRTARASMVSAWIVRDGEARLAPIGPDGPGERT